MNNEVLKLTITRVRLLFQAQHIHILTYTYSNFSGIASSILFMRKLRKLKQRSEISNKLGRKQLSLTAGSLLNRNLIYFSRMLIANKCANIATIFNLSYPIADTAVTTTH